MLSLIRSILLKTIPEFGSAGLIVKFAITPVCRATPLKETLFLTVFWVKYDTTTLYLET